MLESSPLMRINQPLKTTLKSFVTNLCLVLVTLLMLALLAEALVRVMQHQGYLDYYGKQAGKQTGKQIGKKVGQQQPKKVKLPKVFHSTNSKLFVEIDPADPLVNALGFRGPLPTIQKPQGVFRIVVLGDSVAYGYGVSDEESFARQLERSLNSKGKRVEVLNLAVCGYGLEVYPEVYRYKARQFAPDLVILAYVLNDLAPVRAVVDAIGGQIKHNATLKRVGKVSQFAAWLYDSYGKAADSYYNNRNFNAQYFGAAGQQMLKENLALLNQEVSADGVQLMAFIFPYLHNMENYPLQGVHGVIHEAMQKAGITFYDLLEDYRGHDNMALRLDSRDFTHPNAEGHRISAKAMEKYIQQSNLF